MTHHMLSAPDQPISALTIADLEAIIAEVVRRVLREEMRRAAGLPANGQSLSEAFLATFGAWEDPRPAEAIVSEIYESRTVATSEVSL
jgi:hypothetical protein